MGTVYVRGQGCLHLDITICGLLTRCDSPTITHQTLHFGAFSSLTRSQWFSGDFFISAQTMVPFFTTASLVLSPLSLTHTGKQTHTLSLAVARILMVINDISAKRGEERMRRVCFSVRTVGTPSLLRVASQALEQYWSCRLSPKHPPAHSGPSRYSSSSSMISPSPAALC